jgi:hypothetical protein
MNPFFVSLIITLLFVGLNTTFVLRYMTNFVSKASKPESTSLLTEALKIFVFFILTWFIISVAVPKNKENFYFEVSKGLPKCSRGYIGRPNSFQYTSNNDINCGYGADVPAPCTQVAQEAQKDPQFGWDGIVNVKPDNIFGGCGCAESGMTVYPYVNSTYQPNKNECGC